MSLEDEVIDGHFRYKPCDSCHTYIPNASRKCVHCGELTAAGRRALRRKEEQKHGRA